jgi:hypothetical protein
MIKKPEANFPLEKGFLRHQFLYVVDTKTWDSWDSEKKLSNLIDYFGVKGYDFIEKVRDDDNWKAWHLWIDHIAEQDI